MTSLKKQMNRAIRRRNFRIDFLILIGVMAFGVLPPLWGAVTETRIYRDLARQTPFGDVVVMAADLVARGVVVTGTMRKFRCVFDDQLTGYVVFPDGSALRVPIDTSVEDAATGVSGNRPPVDAPQRWGPWLVVYDRPGTPPVRWMIFAHHRDCPSGPPYQVNLFADGLWPRPTE